VGTDGVVTYYAGSFVYTGSSLTYLQHPEGLYFPSSGCYHYFLKDHLGNTRMMVKTLGTGGTIVQQTDYYPFGMEIASYSSGVENRYRYNGKEKQSDLINSKNLDWYDYGARFYDPSLGRWHSVDPLVEKRSNESPFAYCGNNPVSRIDPTGMIWDDEQAADDLKKKAFEKIISLTNRIGDKNKEMADKNTSEDRKTDLNEEITGMMDRINELGNSINQIDQLGGDQDNTYVLNDGTTKDSPLVGDVTKADDGKVSIYAPSEGLAFHEIRHISQSLNSGGLKFINGNLQNAGTDDHTRGNMEIEAYQSQFSFTGKKIGGKIIYSPKAITYELIGSYRDKTGNLLYPFMNSSK
jgi:RHS repeat-associated protein